MQLFLYRADIAVIGLAVMGQNLILNMNDHGYVVCAYNRTPDKVTNFLENEAKNTNVMITHVKNPPEISTTFCFTFRFWAQNP